MAEGSYSQCTARRPLRATTRHAWEAKSAEASLVEKVCYVTSLKSTAPLADTNVFDVSELKRELA